jgi:hypothetical protein
LQLKHVAWQWHLQLIYTWSLQKQLHLKPTAAIETIYNMQLIHVLKHVDQQWHLQLKRLIFAVATATETLRPAVAPIIGTIY